ncbi:MAG: ATP-binding protein [Pirellulaceae bacterium]
MPAANPVLLERVIDNLVFNALKYSESGTPVTVAQRVQGSSSDTSHRRGPGIHEADLKQLFDPFFRSREGVAVVLRERVWGLPSPIESPQHSVAV